MLSIFKSRKRKKTRKGNVFYERENLLQTVGELKKIIDRAYTTSTDTTTTQIVFHGNSLDSITTKSIIKDFGEQSFLLKPDNGIDGNTVYFFRLYSEHLKFLIQVHFINNEFFFASTKVYGDALLSDKDKSKIVKRIIKRYLSDTDYNGFDLNISDPDGNIIFTKDDVFFHINYLSNNMVTQALREKHSDYKPPKPGNKLKDTLDELI